MVTCSTPILLVQATPRHIVDRALVNVSMPLFNVELFHRLSFFNKLENLESIPNAQVCDGDSHLLSV
jgi:hypothetical protein